MSTHRTARFARAIRHAVALALFVAVVAPATAQLRDTIVPGQAVLLGVGWVDFSFDGADRPAVVFDYAAPVFIATYRQNDLTVTLAYGKDGDRTLFDAGIAGHAELLSTDASSDGLRLALPLRFDLTRRAVSADAIGGGTVDYAATAVRLGAGGRADMPLGRAAFVQATATGSAGYATRDLGEASGFTYAANAALDVAMQPSARRWGLVAGYAFGFQAWNYGRSNLTLVQSRDVLDYRSLSHRVMLGVRW